MVSNKDITFSKNETNKLNLNDLDLKTKMFSDNNDLKNMDSELLEQDINSILNAIQNDSLELSEDEKSNFINDLKVILDLFDIKLYDSNGLVIENISELDRVSSVSKNSDDNGSLNENNIESSNEFISVDDAVTDLIGVSDGGDSLEKEVGLTYGDETSVGGGDSLEKEVGLTYGDETSVGGGDYLEKEVGLTYGDETSVDVDDALGNLVGNSDDIVIRVNNLTMEYEVSKDKIDSLKEFIIRTIKRNKSQSFKITALKNVSFEITKGDRVGIIGYNGAGKSTLLKVLSKVYDPTEGTIEIKGKIAPLLELGAGFDPNYSGKANIFLNGAFLGFPEDFIKEKYDEILEFSELGESINYQVKSYSSGMRAKLGFSIATIVEPDILILDEVLSVGDIKFRRKSADKIKSLINSGITVLLVSHSVGQIRDLCNKAIWIDKGELKMSGDVNEVCDAYVKSATEATKEELKNISLD